MPRSASDAAASQPMKPEPMTTADDAVCAASRSAAASASERNSRARRPPGTGGASGAEPHAKMRMSNSVALIADKHRALAQVQPVDRRTPNELDRPVIEPLRGMQSDIVGLAT